MTRTANVERVTKETSVNVSLDLDGGGNADADSGIPFLDHMLKQLGTHARFCQNCGTPAELEDR